MIAVPANPATQPPSNMKSTHTLAKILMAVSLISSSCLAAGKETAAGNGAVTQPAAGSALRKEILDGLRPAIEKDLNQKVIFIVNTIRVVSDWAYLQVTPVTPASKPIDFSKTKYKQEQADGVFGGPSTHALLHKIGKQWTVVTFRIGPTDVCWIGWDKPPFNAPPKVLPDSGHQ